MRSVLTSLCYLDGVDKNGQSRFDRYDKWLNYHLKLKSELGFDGILLLDNCSNYGNVDKLLRKYPECITFERFNEHLPTGPGLDYPYCWRGIDYILKHAELTGAKYICLDADGYVLSKRLATHIKQSILGWEALWCSKYGFPDSAMMILCPDAVPKAIEWMGSDWRKHVGKMMETSLPITKVNKDFNSDRFGESRIPQAPYMDYYGQCPTDIELKFEGWN